MKLQTDNLGKVSITIDENPWDPSRNYDRLVIVEREGTGTTYISRKPVPIGTSISNRKYWIKFSKWSDIPYEIVQEFGDSPEVVISQKVVTLKVNELQELIDSIIEKGGIIDERIATAKSELIDGASEEGDTFKKIEDRLSDVEESVGEGGSVDERIAVETQRAQGAEDFLQNQINGLSSQNYVTIAATNTWTLANINSLISTAAGTDAEKIDTVYRVGNWDGSQYDITCYSEYAWNGSSYVHINTKTQIGEVFDISAYYATGGTLAKYANLAEALGTNGVNVPPTFRKGGMSVKYVQSSDDKYVQYRLTADEWSIDTEDWAIADEGVYVENPEFIYVKTDAESKIMWAIKIDGSIYYGAGVPQQVVDYINEKIAELSVGDYEDIVAFLSDYLDSDTTLKTLIDSKLDAEGLDSDALNSVQTIENSEYIQVTTDSEDKILEGITTEGVKQINLPIDTPSATIEHVENPEWISLTTDKEGKILEGITSEGKKKVMIETNFEGGIEGYATKEYVNEKDNEIKEIIGYDNREEVPSYYFANDYLQNKVDTIKSIYSNCASNGDIFFFSTDEHWEYNTKISPALVKYISERVKIDKLFSGGDNTQLVSLGGMSNKQNPAVDEFLSLREKTFNGKLYYAIGNHEYLTGYFDNPNLFDNIDMNNWHDMTRFSGIDEIIYGDSARHYYYVDNKQKKIRYIFLSAFKQKEIQQEIQGYRIIAEADYNDSQVAWLQDVALDVENGWTIIVITHALSSINPIMSDGHCTQVIRYLSEDSKKIAKVLLQYNGNGEIAGVISGHLHADGIAMIDDNYVGLTGTEATGKSIPEIVTTCDTGGKNGFQSWVFYGDYSSRAENTITEQAFDVVIVDKNTKKLSLVRIGAPAYNVFEQDSITGYYPLSGDTEIREVNYGQI